MPAQLKKLRSTGLVFLTHSCEECGTYACFGVGVSIRKAMNTIVAGGDGQKMLGKWYCGEHYQNQGEK
jgi:hypothetical protein